MNAVLCMHVLTGCDVFVYVCWRTVVDVCCASYGHIISNLVFQLLLGIPLEMVHKFWRVGLVYCLGVITGQLSCLAC